MQTFLPYADFVETAKCLDYRRLGKQRVEAKQIYNACVEGTGWKHHPIVKMWKGYENALVEYGIVICGEWKARGYRDSLLDWFRAKWDEGRKDYPLWIGDEDFHASHRSNLLRKDKDYYSRFGWSEPADLPYVWR